MKFTRLRLLGFKSFIDPSDLIIEPGLTGIVGPNGCGKSNLLEAIRWVMGDSRPTSMRGTGMEDVIFGGSATRPMRNNAEVMLFIDNSGRGAPPPYTELDAIEISRRIERDEGSIYRINGRDVRQRDVQLFFADASTGAASPSLVRQGQIAVLINQKPLARRAILEEAAGISGLHQRRHEAELRLRAAEGNLARLDDVIQEVEGQLQGLKRQARQASRYRNLSGHIRRAEALVFLLRWQAAEAQAEVARGELAVADAAVAERASASAEASTAQASAAAALPPLRETEAARGAALQRLTVERNTLDAEETRAREAAQRLRQRIGQSEQDLARERGFEQEATATLATLGEEAGALEEQTSRGESEIADAEEHAQKLSAELGEHERDLERLTSDFAELNASRASLERTRDDAQAQAARFGRALEELRPRLAGAEAEVAGSPGVSQAEEKTAMARASAEETRRAAEAARMRLAAARAAETAARQPFEDAEQDVQRLAAEAGALTDLLRPAGADLWPPLIDSVRVKPGYEAALAAALGDGLDAPLDEAAPYHWSDLGALPAAPALPDGATPLGAFVDGPPALGRRLAFTGVVSLEVGKASHKTLEPGQRLVTERGDLWRWDGYFASADAPSQATIRLEQRNRLAAVEKTLAVAKTKRADAATIFEAARSEAAGAAEAVLAAENMQRARNDALLAAREGAAEVARAAAERMSRLAALEAEAKRIKDAKETAEHAQHAAMGAIAELADVQALGRTLTELRTATAEIRGRTAEARSAVEGLRRAAAERGRRLAAIAEERARWTQRLDAARTQIAALHARIAEMVGELKTLEAVPAQIAQRRSFLLDAIATAEAALRDAADARAEAETALAAADRAAKAADGALAEARETRARAGARAESAQARLAELTHRIRDEVDASPGELEERAGVKPDAELPPIEQAEDRVEKLKREREQLGGVNLRAEEEAAEHEQRLQTLTADRADLDGAIQRLRRGIQSLNREGRERLLESFEKVNANFERLFKELFQGGEARLTFTESDDPLEAGLEILAKPPGKKLTTLSLLSGGEQALTAIALIFAVFLVNPAPICVLDEVDAPLDDANVERFCNLLDEMTRVSDTRFLIITHHALTMSRMNRLFGVTMSERGVSQLVSVSLAEAERVAAAE